MDDEDDEKPVKAVNGNFPEVGVVEMICRLCD